MAKNKKYYWLKLKDDFFATREIKKLRKVAGGDTYTIIYLKMQLLSITKEGILEYEGTERNLIEQLSIELDEDEDNIKMTLAFLESNRLIEKLTEDEYLLNRVPESIGSETSAAERMRKMRETRNVVTPMLQDVSNSCIEIREKRKENKDKREEIEIEEADESALPLTEKPKPKNPFEEYEFSKPVLDVLDDFMKMRKVIKKPMTAKAIKLFANKLKEISLDSEVQIKLLEQSILNNWQTVYPLKDDNWNNGGINAAKHQYHKVKEIKKDFKEREYDFEDLERKLLGW